MNDEATLFQAIRADPEDESLRLVYADLMEERGDRERAEFIRVQCALEHHAPGDRRHAALEARECDLLAYRGRWNAPIHRRLAGGPLRVKSRRAGVRALAYRRGFIEGLVVEADAFLAHADLLFEFGPIRHVRLLAGRDHMTRLADCPHLARLATLDLHGGGLWGGDVSWLTISPHLRALSVLDLSHNFIDGHGVQRLRNAVALRGLTVLRLEGNFGAGPLRGAAVPPRPERLDTSLRRWLRFLKGV